MKMTSLLPLKLLSSFVFFCCLLVPCIALEKKSILEVTPEQMIEDTQVIAQGASDNHTSVVWWIPQEFWEATHARETSVSDVDKAALEGALKGVTLLGVVQADVSSASEFKFYSKEDVVKNIFVSYTDAAEKTQRVTVVEDIGPDLQVILDAMKPVLAQALGNMGENFHFFVLKDSNPDGGRLVNPLKSGVLNVKLEELSGNVINAKINLPLDSLFVPRKCPNGKDAHVTWGYCPWSGEKL